MSEDAEIAAWDKDGAWYEFSTNGDKVKGWVKADEVADFMAMIKAK
jgi:glucan-binding YG repeat protein